MTNARGVGRGVRLGVVWALLVMPAACGPRLMPTPLAVTKGGVDPFAHVDERLRTVEAPVFVATTRKPTGNPLPTHYYGGKRHREILLGEARVRFGRDLDWDQLVELSRAEKRREDPALIVVSYEQFGSLWTSAWPPDMGFDPGWQEPEPERAAAERWMEGINAVLDLGHSRRVTVFVHGFNTKFAGNLAVAAEIWHYMGRDGAVISFDWPSEGSLFSYAQDKSNAEVAVRQLRVLLEFLAAQEGIAEIDVIGHSAGCPVVANALREISLKHYAMEDSALRAKTKLNRVMLAAPDMDLDEALSDSVDGAGRTARSVAVYASSTDRALGLSGDIFDDVRLGRSIGKLTPDERAALIAHDWQWVDATAAAKRYPSFLGHSYFHKNPWVSSDMMLFLVLEVAESDRGLVRDEKTGFLTFPKDYEEELPGVVGALRKGAGVVR